MNWQQPNLLNFILVFILLSNLNYAQNAFKVESKRGNDKVKFKLINNLIIIPVEVNGTPLSFILDSGVNKTILFNADNHVYVHKNEQRILLNGLGGGEAVQGMRSFFNTIKVGDAIKHNQELYVIFDTDLDFSSRLGIPIHGIIGFDLFKDLVIEIKYNRKLLKLSNQEDYKQKRCRKCQTLPLEFYNNKPYINAQVTLNDKPLIVKLLIDSGGSDALWLFEDEKKGIVNNAPYFNDFLGQGLNGAVYGKRSRIRSFTLSSFTLKDVNVSYPDSLTISRAKQFTSRNGSIGGNILRRFNLIFNYKKGKISFDKNNNFNDPFVYNLSGIELKQLGLQLVKEKIYDPWPDNQKSTSQTNKVIILSSSPRLNIALKPAYGVAELREDSPAYRAGIRQDDQVIAINGKAVHNMRLDQVMSYFFDSPGKRIRLKVNRKGIDLNYQFRLEDILKE